MPNQIVAKINEAKRYVHPAMEHQYQMGAVLTTFSVSLVFYLSQLFPVLRGVDTISVAFSILLFISITSLGYIFLNLGMLTNDSVYAKTIKPFIKGVQQTRAHTVERSVNSLPSQNILLLDHTKKDELVYYPEINRVVIPFLSRKSLFNGFTVFLVVMSTSSYWLSSYVIEQIATLSVIFLIAAVLTVNMFWYAYYYRSDYSAITQELKQVSNPKRYINTQYTEAYLLTLTKDSLCKQVLPCSKFFYNKRAENKITLEALVEQSYLKARQINRLISDGVVEPGTLNSEIETIEHILNFFVVETIKRTKDYLVDGDVNLAIAMEAFRNQISPNIIDEIESLHSSVVKMDAGLEYAKQLYIEDLESKLGSDEGLSRLIDASPIPNNEFPELFSLKFETLEDRVTAFNIANEAIPKLLDARKDTDDVEEVEQLDALLDDVKCYIKELATNTDEHKQLIIREQKGETDDVLSLTASWRSSEARKTIGQVRSYINGHKTFR